MLSLKEKIKCLELYLSIKSNNFGDSVKDNLYEKLFEFQDYNFNFLMLLKSEDEIKSKIDLVISKVIMHEHQDGVDNILEEYLLC